MSATTVEDRRLDARAAFLAIFAMAVLGGSYTAGKFALQDLPVFGMLLARMLVTVATLGAFALLMRIPLLYNRDAARFILLQSAFFLMAQTLLFIGLTMTSAGRASILFNMQPFFTLLLLPLLVPTERLTRRRWLGTAVAFIGVALVLAERGTGGGSLLVLISALGWTGNVILNKRMPSEVNPVAVIFWGAVGAVPVFAILALLFESNAAWNPGVAAIASVLYLGMVAAGLGFVLVVWLINTYSASRVNVFVFLSPVFGVLIGWLLLGEPIGAMQAAGAAAVAAGILIVSTET
jgi:drug/metabolite transporter (DMT)-like permease